MRRPFLKQCALPPGYSEVIIRGEGRPNATKRRRVGDHTKGAEKMQQKVNILTGQVLLVCQHQQRHPLEVLVGDHLVEGGLGLRDPVPVVGVHRVDDRVALAVVLVPQGLQLLLATKVPEIEPEESTNDEKKLNLPKAFIT